MNYVQQMLITAMMSPEFVINAILFSMWIPQFVKTYKDVKGNSIIEKVREVVKIESEKVMGTDLTNDEKLERVISAVYFVIPSKYHKYIPRNKLIELINGIYTTYIK